MKIEYLKPLTKKELAEVNKIYVEQLEKAKVVAEQEGLKSAVEVLDIIISNLSRRS